jgi:hypothetical protein
MKSSRLLIFFSLALRVTAESVYSSICLQGGGQAAQQAAARCVAALTSRKARQRKQHSC